MSSLFKKPEPPAGITFMLRGESGTGKTRFALGARRVTKLPCAYVGTDRGAKFYQNDPEVGGFLQVETRNAAEIAAAIKELREDWGKSFGAVVVDTVTDMWNAEQKDFEIVAKDGQKQIPMRAWRPLRDGHEQKLRDLQGLPLHTFLICEEKPIYEKFGDELREVGSREDADKKDSDVCDVRLRLYVEGGTFYAEVLKDRTGTFAMGEIVENPRVELWIKGAVKAPPKPAPEAKPEPAPVANDEAAAKAAAGLIERIEKIANKHEMTAWTKKHAAEINALPEAQKALVVAAGTAKKNSFANGAAAQAGAA